MGSLVAQMLGSTGFDDRLKVCYKFAGHNLMSEYKSPDELQAITDGIDALCRGGLFSCHEKH